MAEDDRNSEIRIDRVPVGRGLGTALAIIVLIGALLLELPAEGFGAPRGRVTPGDG